MLVLQHKTVLNVDNLSTNWTVYKPHMDLNISSYFICLFCYWILVGSISVNAEIKIAMCNDIIFFSADCYVSNLLTRSRYSSPSWHHEMTAPRNCSSTYKHGGPTLPSSIRETCTIFGDYQQQTLMAVSEAQNCLATTVNKTAGVLDPTFAHIWQPTRTQTGAIQTRTATVPQRIGTRELGHIHIISYTHIILI